MKNIDYCIVGGGYAGLFFAHQLIKHNKSFILFCKDDKSASQVSAGMINPAVLKKFTTFWLAQEQIDFLRQTLNEIEQYTHHYYLIDEHVHRIFHDEAERELWLKKSHNEDLAPFLNPQFKKFEGIVNPFETGEVLQSARLNVKDFFTDMHQFLEMEQCIIYDSFQYSSLGAEGNYHDFKFSHVVFCEGMEVKNNPFFSDVEVHPNKGHHLTVELSKELKTKATLKKKHFLFPLENGLHYYGGTYDREADDHEINPKAVEQLKNGLSEFYPHDFTIKEVEFGFRPTVKDRRPIIGNHSEHPNFYIFNGLGARGVLNGCFFAHELYHHIENLKPLHPEVDLMRFKKQKS